MAFVYERIPDSDKNRIDFSQIKVGSKKVDSSRWTIDRQLDAFLLWGYPEREPPHEIWWAYWWQGRVFQVAVIEGSFSIDENMRQVGNLNIANIVPPLQLQCKSAELDMAVKAIRGAIKANYMARASEARWDIVDVKIITPTAIPTPFGLWPPIPEPVELVLNNLGE